MKQEKIGLLKFGTFEVDDGLKNYEMRHPLFDYVLQPPYSFFGALGPSQLLEVPRLRCEDVG